MYVVLCIYYLILPYNTLNTYTHTHNDTYTKLHKLIIISSTGTTITTTTTTATTATTAARLQYEHVPSLLTATCRISTISHKFRLLGLHHHLFHALAQ